MYGERKTAKKRKKVWKGKNVKVWIPLYSNES